MKKYSYVGVSFVILVFGIWFFPKIMERFDQNNINYQLIDIVKEPPSKKILELALIQFSLDIKKIFNTRGKSYKSIGIDILDLTKNKIIELEEKIKQLEAKFLNRYYLHLLMTQKILGN